MVLACAAAIALGVWQYHTWDAKRAAATVDLTGQRPVALGSVIGPVGAFPGGDVGRPVHLRGRWLDGETTYVAHQVRHGYWVVTPVLVGHTAIAVVRGWSPTTTAPPVSGTVGVVGWLQPSDDNGPPDANLHDNVLPALQLAALAQHVPQNLYSAYVVARTTRPAVAGLHPIAAPHPPSPGLATGLRNLLYSLQWWVFAGFAVFVWVRWCRDTVERVRAGQVPSSA